MNLRQFKTKNLENPVPLISDRRDSLGWGICRNKRETAICPSSHLLRGPFEALELWGMEVTQRDVRVEGTDSIPQLCAEGQNLSLLLCGACSQMPVCCMSNSQAVPLSTWHTYTHTQILPPFQWLSFTPPNFAKALSWPCLVSVLCSVSKPLLLLIELSSGVLVARGPCHRLASFTTSVRRGRMDLSQGWCQV